MWIQSRGREDPLEEGMASHPLQDSCLENPVGRGACWATDHGVPKSGTRLSNLTCSLNGLRHGEVWLEQRPSVKQTEPTRAFKM